MRYKIFAMAAALMVPTVCARAQNQALAEAAGNTAFAVNLYSDVSMQKGNVFFSPYSISTAMAMVYGGARGNTAKEIKDTFYFPGKQADLPGTFTELTGALQGDAEKDGQKLRIANALCLTGGDLNADYKALVRNKYQGEVFAGGLDEINGWVKKQTEGKIDKILTGLSANTVCVLLNAVYFKGTWESRFNTSNTRDGLFHPAGAEPVTAPFMNQLGTFRLLETEGFKAIAMPYHGGRFSMVMLLPNDTNELPALEKQLSAAQLNKWLAALDATQPRNVQVAIPKHKLSSSYDLVPVFKDLGIHDAFVDGHPDFSGMDGRNDLYIAQAKHKAFIEVNEEGSEAAAATAVEMATRSMGSAVTPSFRADHPYLMLIRHNPTGTILFMGRVANPAGVPAEG